MNFLLGGPDPLSKRFLGNFQRFLGDFRPMHLVVARTAHALDLGRSSTGSALSALWKAGSVFPVDACASEAAPPLRAFAQVPWKRSARATANFHCKVAAYHPLPKTPCAAIGRCASRGCLASLWEGLSSGWGTSDLYQTPQKAISVFFVPPPDILGVIGRVNATSL